MNILSRLSVAALTLGLAACASQTPTRSTDHIGRAYNGGNNVPSTGIAIEGYCPVAYFALGEPVLGDSKYAATHEGVTYHIGSAEGLALFQTNPDKYVPAYGGWCAFGMASNDKFPADPRHFKIVDGQLMLFLKNESVDALELWDRGDESELVRNANHNWTAARG